MLPAVLRSIFAASQNPPNPHQGRKRAVFVFAAFLLLTGGNARAQGGDPEEPCSGGGYDPPPVAVAVTAVPIVVDSTTAEYFVLYVKHDVDGTEVEFPVLVKLGEAGTTTLSENVAALPAERYRVEKFLVAGPADVDGDCIDDITELADPVGRNPVNPAAAVALSNGAVAVPDRDTFETLSRRQVLKFVLFGMDTARPGVYFHNTKTHASHQSFLDAVGIKRGRPAEMTVGTIIYDPELVAPDGSLGVYYYWLRYDYPYPPSFMARYYTVLAASMPLLEDNLAFHISNNGLLHLQPNLPLLRESRINLVFDEDLYPETTFLALNSGEGYGRLQALEPDDRPHPRDVVIYEALPNELPRVAGIISTVPQTPLSHVNLRAVQDGVPNAFIRGALDNANIDDLLGSYVRYTVTEDGWDLRAVTPAEVDAHHASSRPAHTPPPQRDLSVMGITPLSEISFEDWDVFGVKAANVAVLGRLGFPEGTVPDGFAIPFYFYDEFMKTHGFYDDVKEMLAAEDFQTDFETQDDRLDDLRDAIKDAETPQWIIDALTAMHATFPEGTSLRYRSSTNNEDLPGFNGAGLYDSKTQHPEETEEDGISKSLKQVFAGLWTFRAFTERAFHRIDHLAAAMGVLVHPNYSDELANGVAVSFDPIRGQDGDYYVNAQLGEDLVTNPEAHSVPEELLLYRFGGYSILGTSNLVEPGELLMSDAQLTQLREHLTVIHAHFESLYNPAADEPFAMEIEFKITSDNILAIKQARPWVFEGASQSPPPPPPPAPPLPPPPSGGGGGGSGGSRSQDRHGNTAGQATVVALGETAPWTSSTAGQINPPGDIDYFQFDLPQAGLLVVETTGSTATVGTVWQADEMVAQADSGGARQNFRLEVRVAAGPVVLAVAGNGRQTGAYTVAVRLVAGYLENPGRAAFQSGIGVLSGWVCEADEVEIEMETEQGAVLRYVAAYGTERLDTEPVCGDSDNGFGLLFNWNRLREGEHTVSAYVDDIELGRARVTVTTLGEEFVRGVAGTCEAENFPTLGETVPLEWQQNSQNFVIASGAAPAGENYAGTGGVGYLENPGPNSFQSGVGVISGWVCEAEAVEIAIGNTGRQVAAYGTERLDTQAACGDSDNGFGLLFNWNRLGDGEQTVVAFVDDVELGRATVRVTTLGAEFLRDVAGTCEVDDFPMPGETVTLEWQQNSQNFVMTNVE